MNDAMGLVILVAVMAVCVAVIALLERQMNAPAPAPAPQPKPEPAPRAARAPKAPAPAPRVETGIPAEVVAAIAAAVACLEGGAAAVRGIRRAARPAASRRGLWGDAGVEANTTPFSI